MNNEIRSKVSAEICKIVSDARDAVVKTLKDNGCKCCVFQVNSVSDIDDQVRLERYESIDALHKVLNDEYLYDLDKRDEVNDMMNNVLRGGCANVITPDMMRELETMYAVKKYGDLETAIRQVSASIESSEALLKSLCDMKARK